MPRQRENDVLNVYVTASKRDWRPKAGRGGSSEDGRAYRRSDAAGEESTGRADERIVW